MEKTFQIITVIIIFILSAYQCISFHVTMKVINRHLQQTSQKAPSTMQTVLAFQFISRLIPVVLSAILIYSFYKIILLFGNREMKTVSLLLV